MTKDQMSLRIQQWAIQIERAYGHLTPREFPGPPTDLVREMRTEAARLLEDAGSLPDELGEHARAPERLPQAGARGVLSSNERLYPWPEPVETLSITHIFDGEEVVTAGEDGQTWIATFASRGEAEEFVKGLQAEPGTTVVGQRRRMPDERCMHGRVVCEPCAQMAVKKAIRPDETQPVASNLVSRLRAFPGGVGAEALCREAADEIERLQPAASNLRVIEPYRSKDGVRANVVKHILGGAGCVVIEADTATGDEAEVTLSAREAHDLMLWLQCALSQSSPPETHPPESYQDLYDELSCVRGELEEARIEIERLRPMAESWESYEAAQERQGEMRSDEQPSSSGTAPTVTDGGPAEAGHSKVESLTDLVREAIDYMGAWEYDDLRNWQQRAETAVAAETRTCTCHPDDNPPKPCAQKYALSECRQDETSTLQGWQPIETAPTDGSEFIAFHKEAGVCACFRTGPTSAWYCMDGWNTYTRADGTERPGLTSFVNPPECWMPMPKPPGSPVETPERSKSAVITRGELGVLTVRLAEAEVILARALACDNYEPQHAEWLADATSWLNQPRSTVETWPLRHTLDCDMVRHPNSTRCTCLPEETKDYRHAGTMARGAVVWTGNPSLLPEGTKLFVESSSEEASAPVVVTTCSCPTDECKRVNLPPEIVCRRWGWQKSPENGTEQRT